MKRHTLEYVKNYFRKNNCELLEKKYKNYHFSMKYRCDCGNISKISFANFKAGKKCMKCSGTEKYTFKYIKKYFKDNNCELLEKEYKRNSTKMKYRCECGDISKITFASFKKGTRCIECKKEKLRKSFKHSFKYVYNYFKKNGCELLEKGYKNNSTHMKYKCKCGDINKITFGNFKNSERCAKCAGIQKPSFKYVKDFFKRNNCKLLEKKYKNTQTPMKYKCKCGKISKIRFTSFKKGHRCKNCGNKKQKRFGKDNYHYNPNITDEEREIQRSRLSDSLYREWRNKIFKKNNYICLKCKKRGGELNAHHIKNYKKNKELRLIKSNGITFCKNCHIEFHKIYGKKHNNRKQLKEFLQVKNLSFV